MANFSQILLKKHQQNTKSTKAKFQTSRIGTLTLTLLQGPVTTETGLHGCGMKSTGSASLLEEVTDFSSFD